MERVAKAREDGPLLPVTGLLATLVGILLVLVVGLALWSNLKARGGVERLRETSVVQSAALTFLTRIQEAETGQRGYLLTGDPKFLAPYERAVSLIAEDLRQLETATRSDPAQAQRVAGIADLLGDKLDELARTIALVRENRRADAVALVSAAAGKAAMDDMRTMVTRILEGEDAELLEREAELERWNSLSTGAIALAALATLVLVAVTLQLTKRQFALSETLRGRLARLNGDLEATVERRTREADAARAEAVIEKERAQGERARVELLLQEVNHRVGNNLAMVSAMLGLQVSGTSDEAVRTHLRAAQARVATIANAQRRLRLEADLATVRADEIVESVMADLRATIGDERGVEIETRLEPLLVDSRDAIHLAILANEIATNAAKHAFVGRDVASGEGGGRIVVRLALGAERVPHLCVEDDGCGMPGSQAPTTRGIGQKLVTRLAGQFGGAPRIEPRVGGGTRVEVALPGLALRDA
jgi:two-component sensor histidine kinase/CHASE3 domain sensor protein